MFFNERQKAAICALVLKMSMADGETQSEEVMANMLICQKLGIHDEHYALSDRLTFDGACNIVNEMDYAHRRVVMAAVFLILAADGCVKGGEENLMAEILEKCNMVGFDFGQVQNIIESL